MNEKVLNEQIQRLESHIEDLKVLLTLMKDSLRKAREKESLKAYSNDTLMTDGDIAQDMFLYNNPDMGYQIGRNEDKWNILLRIGTEFHLFKGLSLDDLAALSGLFVDIINEIQGILEEESYVERI